MIVILKDIELGKTRFTEHLIQLNALSFKKWIFETGMLFLSEKKWWGDKGYRRHRHNGLDIRLYETSEGTLTTINEETRIPIIYEGRIVSIIKDFLGRSLFAAHEIYDGNFQLYTIYGHVIQATSIVTGKFLNEGTPVATLAKASDAQVPSHLHVSVALVPKTIPPETLTWDILDKNEGISFLDPGHII